MKTAYPLYISQNRLIQVFEIVSAIADIGAHWFKPETEGETSLVFFSRLNPPKITNKWDDFLAKNPSDKRDFMQIYLCPKRNYLNIRTLYYPAARSVKMKSIRQLLEARFFVNGFWTNGIEIKYSRETYADIALIEPARTGKVVVAKNSLGYSFFPMSREDFDRLRKIK